MKEMWLKRRKQREASREPRAADPKVDFVIIPPKKAKRKSEVVAPRWKKKIEEIESQFKENINLSNLN